METKKQFLSKYIVLEVLIIMSLVAFMVMTLNSTKYQEASLDNIKSVMESLPTVTSLTPKTVQDAGKNLEFDSSLVDEGLYWRVDDIMNVNELLILRIKDDTNRENVLEAINKYLEEKKNDFNGYGTDQYGLLSSAVVTEKGEYLFFGVSPDVLTWESDFSSCFH